MSNVDLQIKDNIAIITIDNEKKLNALTLSMLEQMGDFCGQLERDRSVRAVVVTAKGEKAFCVGADINEWSSLSAFDFARNWVRYGHRLFDQLARLSHPTIAALNGHVFGGGLELAAACDIRVMKSGATLGLPEVSVGVVPGWSGTQRIQRLLPESVLKEMVLFARRIDAQKACQLGFVAEVSDAPLVTATEIARATTQLSVKAIEVAKYMIHAGANEDSSSMIEALGSGMIGATEDIKEGVSAFKAKEKPQFNKNNQ